MDTRRFAFGKNWAWFLSHLNDERTTLAESSVRQLVGELAGKRFLDIGCGSGVFSLAAARNGATVTSFDYDTECCACAEELRRRYGYSDWTIARGSVLDAPFMVGLGSFDVVYAWGVLHHTGDLWTAMEHAVRAVRPSGLLCLAIYNDQGRNSRLWLKIKRLYVRLPRWLRWPYIVALTLPREAVSFVISTLRFDLRRKLASYRDQRGMSYWVSAADWIGGYPFEVAKPEQVFAFCKERGFTLEHLVTQGGGLGCNEFVFRRSSSATEVPRHSAKAPSLLAHAEL